MMDFNQPPQELGISYPAFHFTCSLIVSLPTTVADNGGVIMHEKLPILPNVAGSQLGMPSDGANGTPLFARAVVSNGRSSNATLLACTSSTVDPLSYATQISNRVTRRLALTFWLLKLWSLLHQPQVFNCPMGINALYYVHMLVEV